MPSASHTVQGWSRALAQISTPEVPLADGIAEKRDWLFLVAKQIGSLSGQNISEHSTLNEGWTALKRNRYKNKHHFYSDHASGLRCDGAKQTQLPPCIIPAK
jgi:hypothetical protein